MMRPHFAIVLCLTLAAPLAARAQAPAEPDLEAGKGVEEAPDPTRLDVSRLPPEAAEITRELYAHGLFVEAQAGATGFVGAAADVSEPGPRLSLALGYELATWISIFLAAEGSLHQTKNRPPPAQTSYEMAGGVLGLKLTLPFGPRAAIWASGVGGVVWVGGDVLRGLGFRESHKLGIDYGGELGFDWHVRSRHHSLGLLAGARMYPSLERDDSTLGLYGSLYLRYVFGSG
jgi:hypothetical protein